MKLNIPKPDMRERSAVVTAYMDLTRKQGNKTLHLTLFERLTVEVFPRKMGQCKNAEYILTHDL
jgi:hypothetical protein